MKYLIGTLLFGSTLFAAELPNPEVGECVIADAVVTRSEPTMIDSDGQVTGMRIYSVCSHQEPNGTGGIRTVDDTYVTDVDLEQAELLAGGAAEMVAADNDVFAG